MEWSVVAVVVAVAVAYGIVRAARPLARRLAAHAVPVPPALVLAAGAAAVLGLGVGFAEILDAVVENDDLTAVDRPVVAWVAAHRPAGLSPFVVGVTHVGDTLVLAAVLTAVAVTLARRRRSWQPVLVPLVAVGGCALLVAATKLIIARDRPDPLLRVVTETGYSFPSGHSATALVGLATLAWLIGRTARGTAWVAAGLLTVAIGASRVYLGVHYPSDVLGGWVLGAAWFLTVILAEAAWRRRPRGVPMRRPMLALAMAAVAAVSALAGIVGTLALTDPLARESTSDEARVVDRVPAVTRDQARDIALAHAGEGRATEIELEWEFGVLVWSVDLMRDVTEYDVDIDAATGAVLRYGLDD